MVVCGVYQITSKSTGHRYVGSAENIDHRWRDHLRKLKRGKHTSKGLQQLWAERGETDLELIVLEVVPQDQLEVREQHFLDTLKPELNSAKEVNSRNPYKEPKVTTTVRLPEKLLHTLKQYGWLLHRSHSELMEEALVEYFKAHQLARLQLNVTAEQAVLLSIQGDKPCVLEVITRNGVSVEELQDRLGRKYNTRVNLVMEAP